MPYKDKAVANRKSREAWAADLESNRRYAREYARARKAGIPWVNPVPKQRVNRKGIPVGVRTDIAGQRFGHLVAVKFSRMEPSPNGGMGKQYFWEFICDCGNAKDINRGNVTGGATGTCGNCRNGKPITPEGATRKTIFNTYKRSASERGYEFALEEDEFIPITKLPCAICGLPPSQVFKQSHTKTSKEYFCLYTGVDRINNDLGYVSGNVRPCCKECNLAKHARPEYQFQEWIQRLIKFQSTESSVQATEERD